MGIKRLNGRLSALNSRTPTTLVGHYANSSSSFFLGFDSGWGGHFQDGCQILPGIALGDFADVFRGALAGPVEVAHISPVEAKI